MILRERPYQYNWSKNDIRYAAEVSDVDLPNITGQVKIMYAPSTGGSFVELITLSDLKPNADGYIYVYIQDYLNSLLEYNVPDMSNNVTPATNQVNRFYIEFREVTDDDLDPAWITTETSFPRFVMKGGIEKLKHSYNNYFINYFNSNKPFFTWLPGNRFVYSDQLCFLAFLNTSGGTSVGFKLKFVFTDVAGNTYTYTYTFTQNDIIFHLNVSPTQIGFPTFTDALWYYDVQVTNASDVALTEAYRIYVEYRPVYEFWDLGWHNSLGGFDTSRVVGETTITIASSFTENGAGKDIAAIVNKTRSAYLLHTAIKKRNNFKGDIGFQKNKEENEALQEVLLSKSIYQVMNDLWLPVLNLQQNLDLRTSKSRMFSFPIQWQLASEEEVFTPKDRSFSVGEIATICDPVTFGSHGAMPDGTLGAPYSFTVPLTGDMPYTITAATGLPDGLTAAIVGSNLVISGTPTTLSTDNEISITVENCAEAIFTDTIDILATRWLPATETGGDDTFTEEEINIQGQADEEIEVTVTVYTNDDDAIITFDGTAVTAVSQNFSFTLDSNGLSADIVSRIDAALVYPGHSYGALAKFTISSASGGSIGTPADYQISKAFT